MSAGLRGIGSRSLETSQRSRRGALDGGVAQRTGDLELPRDAVAATRQQGPLGPVAVAEQNRAGALVLTRTSARPWNGASVLSWRAVLSPVAAGNTVVVKPSELAPIFRFE